MRTDVLINAGVDYDFCVRRFAGRAMLFEKALKKFIKDDTFPRIRAAYEEGDSERLLASAHEFKGMCGNIGLTALYEGADAIVKLLRSESYTTSELSAAYDVLAETYNRIHTAAVASTEETV